MLAKAAFEPCLPVPLAAGGGAPTCSAELALDVEFGGALECVSSTPMGAGPHLRVELAGRPSDGDRALGPTLALAARPCTPHACRCPAADPLGPFTKVNPFAQAAAATTTTMRVLLNSKMMIARFSANGHVHPSENCKAPSSPARRGARVSIDRFELAHATLRAPN
jgi:hypothetical protein